MGNKAPVYNSEAPKLDDVDVSKFPLQASSLHSPL